MTPISSCLPVSMKDQISIARAEADAIAAIMRRRRTRGQLYADIADALKGRPRAQAVGVAELAEMFCALEGSVRSSLGRMIVAGAAGAVYYDPTTELDESAQIFRRRVRLKADAATAILGRTRANAITNTDLAAALKAHPISLRHAMQRLVCDGVAAEIVCMSPRKRISYFDPETDNSTEFVDRQGAI